MILIADMGKIITQTNKSHALTHSIAHIAWQLLTTKTIRESVGL